MGAEENGRRPSIRSDVFPVPVTGIHAPDAGGGGAVGAPLRDWSNSFRTYRRRAAELVASADTRHDTPAFLLEMLAVWVADEAR